MQAAAPTDAQMRARALSRWDAEGGALAITRTVERPVIR
jgi:hypothetical protein